VWREMKNAVVFEGLSTRLVARPDILGNT